MTRHLDCHLGRQDCPGYDVDIDMSDPAKAFEIITDAKDAHYDRHMAEITENHIRKQINPRRIRTGNQFYKNRVKLSAAEDGSQTLCGAPATVKDMGWGDTRGAKSLAYVTCETCKQIRQKG